jgi:predicted transcriptional regulator
MMTGITISEAALRDLHRRLDEQERTIRAQTEAMRALSGQFFRLEHAVASFCAAVDSDPHMHQVLEAFRCGWDTDGDDALKEVD